MSRGAPARPTSGAATDPGGATGSATVSEPGHARRPGPAIRRPRVIRARTPAIGLGEIESIRLGPFPLESGASLPELIVAYRHDGPGPQDGPQVLVIHALTGSADAAGDWWAPLIGPSRALDTDRYGVLCANLLGGRYGTTGPMARDPRTGHPYGSSFPAVSTRDQARALWALLDAIGIPDLALVTGGSLGGMVALEVALERPTGVETVMPIAAPATTGALAIAWDHLQLELLDRLGEDGLALARELAMTTYRSEADLEGRFGHTTGPDGRHSVVSYLEHQGRKLVERFDPWTYRVLVGAMDRHDIGRDRGGTVAALGGLADARVRVVGLGIEGDLLYGPDQVRRLVDAAAAAGIAASYRELRSTKGHDAFLVEWDQLTEALSAVLADRNADAAEPPIAAAG